MKPAYYPSPADTYDAKELSAIFERLMCNIKPRTRLILELRFGFDGHEPHTLEAVGEKIGIGKERVRQIINRQLCLFRHWDYDKFFNDFRYKT